MSDPPITLITFRRWATRQCPDRSLPLMIEITVAVPPGPGLTVTADVPTEPGTGSWPETTTSTVSSASSATVFAA
jgi:hypothetical protein